MPLARGARLGPYEISGLIGAGGMGEVSRARDTRLGAGTSPSGSRRLLDFGLAKLLETGPVRTESPTAASETDAGTRLGTVGVVLYEMLERRRAFLKPNTVETLHAILSEDPPELSGWDDDSGGSGPCHPPVSREAAGGAFPVGARRKPTRRAGAWPECLWWAERRATSRRALTIQTGAPRATSP